MSGITSMGTTYTLPNYTGILYALTPTDTPFFSSIGGLSGGGQTTSVQYEWQTYDLRGASQVNAVQLEGAAAPTAQERVRGNVTNICQIHQEQVSVSYTKQGAFGQKAGVNNAAQNPITNETRLADHADAQADGPRHRVLLHQRLVQQVPTDNTTARKTKGLISALIVDQRHQQRDLDLGRSLGRDRHHHRDRHHAGQRRRHLLHRHGRLDRHFQLGRAYYVVQKSTNAFKVSLTSGGSAVTIGTATVVLRRAVGHRPDDRPRERAVPGRLRQRRHPGGRHGNADRQLGAEARASPRRSRRATTSSPRRRATSAASTCRRS
jgi:hypothetical protein